MAHHMKQGSYREFKATGHHVLMKCPPHSVVNVSVNAKELLDRDLEVVVGSCTGSSGFIDLGKVVHEYDPHRRTVRHFNNQLLSKLYNQRIKPKKESTCDVMFHVGDDRVEFPAHSFVLDLWSEALTSMRSGAFREATTGVITLPDDSPKEFEVMLDWMYGLTFSRDMTVAELLNVHVMAEKYLVTDLADSCLVQICLHRNVNLVLELLRHPALSPKTIDRLARSVSWMVHATLPTVGTVKPIQSPESFVNLVCALPAARVGSLLRQIGPELDPVWTFRMVLSWIACRLPGVPVRCVVQNGLPLYAGCDSFKIGTHSSVNPHVMLLLIHRDRHSGASQVRDNRGRVVWVKPECVEALPHEFPAGTRVRLSDGSEYVVRGLCLSSDKAETFDLAILVNSEDVEVCVPTEDLLHWYEDGDEDEDEEEGEGEGEAVDGVAGDTEGAEGGTEGGAEGEEDSEGEEEVKDREEDGGDDADAEADLERLDREDLDIMHPRWLAGEEEEEDGGMHESKTEPSWVAPTVPVGSFSAWQKVDTESVLMEEARTLLRMVSFDHLPEKTLTAEVADSGIIKQIGFDRFTAALRASRKVEKPPAPIR